MQHRLLIVPIATESLIKSSLTIVLFFPGLVEFSVKIHNPSVSKLVQVELLCSHKGVLKYYVNVFRGGWRV